MRKKIKLFFLLTSFTTLLVMVLAGVVINLFCFTSQLPSTYKKSIKIEKGRSFDQIAYALKKAKLLKSTTCFKAVAWWRKESSHIQAGEYLFPVHSTPLDILDILVKGKTRLYSITFPEGYNIYEIAYTLEEKGFLKQKDFISLSVEPRLINELIGEKIDSLEGYLFPDTYKISKPVSSKTLIKLMVNRFFAVYSRLSGQPPMNLSRHEVVTLASIVEKETGVPQERNLIAGVFYNRLKKNMRLESDPTILYGMMKEKGQLIELNIRKKDILRKTAYNTYRINGFPAGPISNPGAKSLQAVFTPQNNDFLYFVSRNDGTHVFSANFKAHQRAVNRYQKSLLKKKK